MPQAKRLTPEECDSKVAECRELAKHARDPNHQVMLNHMAETWARIREDLRKTRPQ